MTEVFDTVRNIQNQHKQAKLFYFLKTITYWDTYSYQFEGPTLKVLKSIGAIVHKSLAKSASEMFSENRLYSGVYAKTRVDTNILTHTDSL